MKSKLLKLLIVILIIPVFIAFFYQFATTDRGHNYAKEFETDIESVLTNTDFKIDTIYIVNHQEIDLPIAQTLRVVIQRNLATNYSKEYGQNVIITSTGEAKIICKSLFAGDHLVGMTVEFLKVDEATKKFLKERFLLEFSDRQILWIE